MGLEIERFLIKTREYDLCVVEEFAPNVVIMQLGTNNLTTISTVETGSAIEGLCRLLYMSHMELNWFAFAKWGVIILAFLWLLKKRLVPRLFYNLLELRLILYAKRGAYKKANFEHVVWCSKISIARPGSPSA